MPCRHRHAFPHLIFCDQICFHHFLLFGQPIVSDRVVEIFLYHQARYRAAVCSSESCILHHHSDGYFRIILWGEPCEDRVVIAMTILYSTCLATEAYAIYLGFDGSTSLYYLPETLIDWYVPLCVYRSLVLWQISFYILFLMDILQVFHQMRRDR